MECITVTSDKKNTHQFKQPKMKKIKVVIKNHPTLGLNRAVQFEGIEYLSYTLSEAKLIWHERFLDEAGEIIEDDTIPIRRIVTPISNANKVTAQGVMIIPENVMALNPIGVDESEEDYKLRIEQVTELLLETSIPEFDFWMGMVKWHGLIKQAAGLLETFDRFDRV
jgi:hypothetical protein